LPRPGANALQERDARTLDIVDNFENIDNIEKKRKRRARPDEPCNKRKSHPVDGERGQK
jgi:hypothetical protein